MLKGTAGRPSRHIHRAYPAHTPRILRARPAGKAMESEDAAWQQRVRVAAIVIVAAGVPVLLAVVSWCLWRHRRREAARAPVVPPPRQRGLALADAFVSAAVCACDAPHTCAVCLEHVVPGAGIVDGAASSMEVTLDSCGHRFHEHCVAEWLSRVGECPTCRAPVKERSMPPLETFHPDRTPDDQRRSSEMEIMSPDYVAMMNFSLQSV